ncbi:MAG: cation:dicarboxylase symporter family transporter [Lachnospiraceae bacterium]|nr:cation:dicarboxylase symporter family transporter [Lachnospiraceae bacterium]
MAPVYKDYPLSAAVVDEISAEVQAYLKQKKLENRNIQRIRLTVEEMLLNLLEKFGEGARISVAIGKRSGQQVFRLRYDGEAFDPTDTDETWSGDVLKMLGISPSWSYRGRTNTVSLCMAEKPKKGITFYILVAMGLAALIGVLGTFLPETFRKSVDEIVLTPVVHAFMGLVTTFAGLMIGLTVCGGMLGMGDSPSAGRLCRRFVLRLLAISFLVGSLAAAASLPFLDLNYTLQGHGGTETIGQISELLFGILPSNPIDPFKNGNTLQIIVIALFLATAMIALGGRAGKVRELVCESAAVMQRVVATVCSLVPLLAFSLIVRQIWTGEAGVFLAVIKPIVIVIAMNIVISAVLLFVTSLRIKRSPGEILKSFMPPFIVAFTSSSGVAAMTLSMETLQEKFGVKKNMAGLMYPLGTMFLKAGSVAFFSVLCFSLAETYGLDVSPSWIVSAVIISTLVVIAIPPIPNAALLGFAVMFSGLGIPSEAIVLGMAADMILDFVNSGFNVLMLCFETVGCAKRYEPMIEEKKTGSI